MAEELSVAMSYTKDDFYCPFCQEVLKMPVWTVACQHIFWNSNRSETSTSDNTESYQGNTSSSDHPTFKCPLCQESNFTRQCLLDHCNSNHPFHAVPVICPICVSLPWGDPSSITRNFISHLNQRHQFDYGEFVNLQLDEETQCQTAAEESFRVNI
ncbi:E3 ubiquitin-protein ligase RNF138-like isoform X4 [Octodon degus]|uniref:E3 ubiquitin-protein ligase RNF138-like isoform X4 n=1 Tax=Octodon degus TaxID=10160 RepID=A0A6P3FAQ9_OCTDE|nr:E3 ubiquitin-protein ligase RNF138-like isoform X4 [Octodon degus]